MIDNSNLVSCGCPYKVDFNPLVLTYICAYHEKTNKRGDVLLSLLGFRFVRLNMLSYECHWPSFCNYIASR